METHVASLNGREIDHVPTPPGRGSTGKDCGAVASNNFSNFAVDRTVSYPRPAVARVATSRNQTFCPGAQLEPAPRLAGRIVVKAVLGPDGGLNRRQQPQRGAGRNSPGLSLPGTAPYTGFRRRPAQTWPGYAIILLIKLFDVTNDCC
jgi:hypothetical protein